MNEEKRECRKCKKVLPLDRGHFKIIHCRGGAAFTPTGRTTFAGVCTRCAVTSLSAGRDVAQHRTHEQAVARKVIVCNTCGKEKPATDRNFSRRPTGILFKTCRTCKKEYISLWRQTPSGKRALKRYLHSKSRRVALKRYRDKIGSDEMKRRWVSRSRRACLAYNALRTAVDKGLIIKPKRCQCCKKRCERPYSLRAYFLSGYDHPLNMTFMCGRCCREAREAVHAVQDECDEGGRVKIAKATAKQYGIPFEVADGLTVSHEEWRDIHAAHVAAVVRERASEAPREVPQMPAEFWSSPWFQRWHRHEPSFSPEGYKTASSGREDDLKKIFIVDVV